jgi:hypothetical protein
MFSLALIAFNNLPSYEINVVKNVFNRNISSIDMSKFQQVATSVELKYGGKCFNCEPLESYGLVCRNCLIFGHTVIRPESNMKQVYINYDDIEQTELMIMEQELYEYQQTLQEIEDNFIEEHLDF